MGSERIVSRIIVLVAFFFFLLERSSDVWLWFNNSVGVTEEGA